jgi:hypothetical protein
MAAIRVSVLLMARQCLIYGSTFPPSCAGSLAQISEHAAVRLQRGRGPHFSSAGEGQGASFWVPKVTLVTIFWATSLILFLWSRFLLLSNPSDFRTESLNDIGTQDGVYTWPTVGLLVLRYHASLPLSCRSVRSFLNSLCSPIFRGFCIHRSRHVCSVSDDTSRARSALLSAHPPGEALSSPTDTVDGGRAHSCVQRRHAFAQK